MLYVADFCNNHLLFQHSFAFGYGCQTHRGQARAKVGARRSCCAVEASRSCRCSCVLGSATFASVSLSPNGRIQKCNCLFQSAPCLGASCCAPHQQSHPSIWKHPRYSRRDFVSSCYSARLQYSHRKRTRGGYPRLFFSRMQKSCIIHSRRHHDSKCRLLCREVFAFIPDFFCLLLLVFLCSQLANLSFSGTISI